MEFTSFAIKFLANEEVVLQMKLFLGKVRMRSFLTLNKVSRPESHVSVLSFNSV